MLQSEGRVRARAQRFSFPRLAAALLLSRIQNSEFRLRVRRAMRRGAAPSGLRRPSVYAATPAPTLLASSSSPSSSSRSRSLAIRRYGNGSDCAPQDSRLRSQKGGIELKNFPFGSFRSEICTLSPRSLPQMSKISGLDLALGHVTAWNHHQAQSAAPRSRGRHRRAAGISIANLLRVSEY